LLIFHFFCSILFSYSLLSLFLKNKENEIYPLPFEQCRVAARRFGDGCVAVCYCFWLRLSVCDCDGPLGGNVVLLGKMIVYYRIGLERKFDEYKTF